MAVLGIDTGGTFTDVVRRGPGGLAAWKVPSTPDDPARAVADAVRAAGGVVAGDRVHHGTTVATNTVLTRTGARVALVTTRGFEDVLALGRGARLDLHDLSPARTVPLVARADVFGCDGRLGARGEVVRPLSAASLDRLARALRASGAEAVAVCLLHATASPAQEDRVARRFARLGIPVHASHRVSADARELERAEATVLDAYVGPRIRAYVARVASALPPGALSVLRSDGTRMSAADVDREPVRTLLSGPAAGASAALALAKRLGLGRALTFDVGGTSTDVAWIEGDTLPVTTGLSLAGFAMGVPSLDVHSVGAGGGSIVEVDAGGALRVGPASAGARPGPACYGLGGPFTVTDAHLLLARLPSSLLGGRFPLDEGPARRAGLALAHRAGCSLRRLCEGAIVVAEATTARALRVASAAAGRDPRGAALLAFGGAGGLLAARVANALGIEEVVVPWSPGTFAAQGARTAPRAADASEAVGARDERGLGAVARRLESAARAVLARGGERVARVVVEADARYRGQGTEIPVPFTKSWRAAFHAAHRARRGWDDAAREVEITRLRARAIGSAGDVEAEPASALRPGRSRAAPAAGRARGVAGSVPVHRRDDLVPGERVVGPAVVVEDGATTWVPPRALLVAARDGTLRLHGRSS